MNRTEPSELEKDAELEAEIEELELKDARDQALLKRQIPLPLKIFGGLCIVVGSIFAILLALIVVSIIVFSQRGDLAGEFSSTATLIILIAQIALMALLAALFAIFGFRLLHNRRKRGAQITELMIVVLIGMAICNIMLTGFSPRLIPCVIVLVFLIVMQSYLDPSLAEERTLQRKLRDMETRTEARKGILGRDETGKGYISLNFFNLFWIFLACSVLGLLIEAIYHVTVVNPGHFEDRAGMLYGPFSPIYGFGAVIMTIVLNRFHKRNVLLIFVISAIIGGAFEYLVSWFLQYAFGIVAWDYSNTFLSFDGRTNAMFMVMWGVLGVVWIKLFLPWMLKLVNLIPWDWRYAITTLCAILVICDGALTLTAFDCWYGREAGKSPDSAITRFCATHYDNAFMQNRFQTMSIDPSRSTRTNEQLS